MLLLVLLSIPLFSSSSDEVNCQFRVILSNGSRSWCFDEECHVHLDLVSLKAKQCRTDHLSLRFSSYSSFRRLVDSSLSRVPLASLFAMGRPHEERLLQIEFLSPLVDNRLFEFNQLCRLSGPISNIDTLEVTFPGKITTHNSPLLIDREIFISDRQQTIDTLRLIFNCTETERVEWELVKSIESLPQSPCPQQIRFSQETTNMTINRENRSNHTVVLSTIVFVVIMFLLLLVLLAYNCYFHRRWHQQSCNGIIASSNWNSRTELVTLVERF